MKSLVRITALVMLVLLAAFFPSCSRSGVEISIDGKKIYTDSPVPSACQQSAKGNAQITVSNHSDSDVSFIIYTNSDKPRSELYCKSGEKASVSAVFEKTDLAVDGIATVEKSICAYVFTARGLEAALNDADSIFLMDDISLEGDLTVSRAAALHTASHTLKVDGSIYLTSSESGDFKLTGSIFADSLFADAPFCNITIPENLVPEDINKSIAASSLNGEALEAVRTVSSEKELQELCSGGIYPSLHSGSVLRLHDFEVTQKHTIKYPVSLKLENVTLQAPLCIETELDGTVSVSGEADPKYIKINAPKCDIEWERCKYTVFDAAKKYTARSLNGVAFSEAVLGGAEEKALEITLDMGENMTCGAVWKHTAPYTYTAVLTSPVAPSALKNACLKITSEGAELKAVYDSFCKSADGVDLLAESGASFTSDGARYRLITKSDCKLPVVVIDTGGVEITSKEDYIPSVISVESDFSADSLPSTPAAEAEIAGRGNTTWYWSSKKPYKIKFESDTSILGMAASKKWVLLSNYADKSLIRNYVALEAAKTLDQIDCYATQYPVDVFLGGEYAGVYTIGEKVEEGNGRAYIHADGTAVDCGFLLELNGDAENGENMIKNTPLGNFKIIYPGKRLTPDQSKYIGNYIASVSSAVTTSNDPSQYIDLESFADFILMLELSYNSDSCFRRSVFFAKDAGGALRVSQMWDFDLAFGNSYADGDYGEWATLSNENYVNTTWSRPLMSNNIFLKVLKDRWELNKDALLSAALEAVEHGEYLVSPSASANFEKWDIMYRYVGMEPDANYQCHTFEDQIEYLRKFITDRAETIDGKLSEINNG